MRWCDGLRHHSHPSCLLSPCAEDHSSAALAGQAACALVCHSHERLKRGGLSHRWCFSCGSSVENTNLEMSVQVGSARQERREGKYAPSCFPTCEAGIVVLFAALLFSPFLLLLLWLLSNYGYISGQRSGLAAWGSVLQLRRFPEWMIALCMCPLHFSHCPEYCVCLGVSSMCINNCGIREVCVQHLFCTGDFCKPWKRDWSMLKAPTCSIHRCVNDIRRIDYVCLFKNASTGLSVGPHQIWT